MKTVTKPLLTIMLLLAVSCSHYSHIYEPYNYEQNHYVDNLPTSLIPDIFLNVYYHNLNSSDYNAFRTNDDFNQRVNTFVYSKKAKDGYLFVNKQIDEYVSTIEGNTEINSVSYYYNDKAVTSDMDVMKVVGLKKNRIFISKLKIDESLGSLTVYIESK